MDPALEPGRKRTSTSPVTPIQFTCSDGQVLHGNLFEANDPPAGTPKAMVVIACATGVRASYYRRYAAFLAGHGLNAVTFDYRGIGASAPESLRGFRARWHDWGQLDIEAALAWARERHADLPLHFVGHSFGGFGVGLTAESRHLTRILTVGAQHAHWRDYAKGHRTRFVARWHVAMPLLTLGRGFFPGKTRRWLEDLPRGVALDWARGRKDFTMNAPPSQREQMRAAQRRLRAPILAVAPTDDPFASPRAVARSLAYTPNAPMTVRFLEPHTYGKIGIGHFGLFHERHRDDFWRQTLAWLEHGVDPWDGGARPVEGNTSVPAVSPVPDGAPGGGV
ncbi:alpha/beta fold hydrolase [Paeniglutamicibacter sp. ABSL32-1]|uniref:alpha/beta hydrolase family protein n=1 Tax=Paeniglutamicibacter quisquiliarum TaxID=2849498 RepID=UPI001C2DD198|nr:alpha/beta fold hydrolase [Paeniglutamicibacter quisquiliarum]MBV1778615.1 alpha/beta fold hydrolase [Paeniglutamicibacter quisquiliarum]